MRSPRRARAQRAVTGGGVIAVIVVVTLALAASAGLARANPYNVSEVPKLIGSRDARRLHDAGVHSTDELLRRTATTDQRKALARQVGLPGPRLAQLARCADLLRLANIGPEFVILLDASGIKSIPDLATRSPAALTAKTAAVNRARHLAKPAPTEAQIRDWINQAGKLPAVLAAG